MRAREDLEHRDGAVSAHELVASPHRQGELRDAQEELGEVGSQRCDEKQAPGNPDCGCQLWRRDYSPSRQCFQFVKLRLPGLPRWFLEDFHRSECINHFTASIANLC